MLKPAAEEEKNYEQKRRQAGRQGEVQQVKVREACRET
jgi:hypothetical protein